MKITLNKHRVDELLEEVDHRIDELQELETSVGKLARHLEVATRPLDRNVANDVGDRSSGVTTARRNDSLRYREMSDEALRDIRFNVEWELARRNPSRSAIPCDGLTKSEIDELQTRINRMRAVRGVRTDY